MPQASDESHLARQTLSRATRALQSGQAAGLPEVVELVQTLSEKAQEISVQELAQVVEKDAAVLTKILSIANAFGYNPTHAPVNTVTAAIQVIGFERIRTLAISLLLFEQSNRLQSPAERRDAAAMALFSGCLAKSAAELGLPIDAEEAFICASLRHFGRIVMLTFMTDEYRQAQGDARGRTEDEAFRAQFGLTPLELGHELLKAEHLPEEILVTLKKFKPEKMGAAISPTEQRLALAEFSEEFCSLVFDSSLSHEAFEKRTQLLGRHYGRALPGIADRIDALLSTTELQLARLTEGLGTSVIPRQLNRNLRNRILHKDPVPEPSAPPDPTREALAEAFELTQAHERVLAAQKPETSDKPDVAPAPETAVSQSTIDELGRMALDPLTSDETLYALALGIIAEAFGAPECMLFLKTRANKRELGIIQGRGALWRKLRASASIRPGERTVLGLCLSRRENILIHNAEDASFKQHAPEWLRSESGLGAFVLVPILDRHANHGVLLVGWPEAKRIVITPQHKDTLHRLNRVLSGKKNEN